MEDVVIIFVIVILCYSIWKYLKYPKNLPPGPTGIPVLGYLPFLGRQLGIERGYDEYRQLHKYMGERIDKMEAMPRNKRNEFNFVHEWFQVYPKTNPQFDHYRNELIVVIIDLLLAGADTTAFTLQWAILYMMKHPEIQQKVQKEIDQVIGNNEPTMADKNKMPYTEATILEASRIMVLVPIGGPHTNATTTTINGYTIPKGSLAFANIWGIHHDPIIFPNPEEFHCERFLQNGQLKKNDELIPFSIGKRQCVGELLARMELFLYFTSLLQHFTFSKPEGATLDFDYDYAQVLTPRPQNVCAIPRLLSS